MFWCTPISYSAFCITLFKECFSLMLIKKILKVPDSSSEIFLVIKTIGLIETLRHFLKPECLGNISESFAQN